MQNLCAKNAKDKPIAGDGRTLFYGYTTIVGNLFPVDILLPAAPVFRM